MSDLISRSALIKRFKELKGADTLANMFISDVLTEIKNQPPVEAVPTWIPCSERMPKEGEWVLCSCQAKIIEVLRYEYGDWYKEEDRIYMRGFVIAWMPLPEPYRADMRKKV